MSSSKQRFKRTESTTHSFLEEYDYLVSAPCFCMLGFSPSCCLESTMIELLKCPFISIKTQKLIFTVVKFTCRSPFHQGFNTVKTILLIYSHPPRYHRSLHLSAELNSNFFQKMLSQIPLREIITITYPVHPNVKIIAFGAFRALFEPLFNQLWVFMKWNTSRTSNSIFGQNLNPCFWSVVY